MIVAGIGFGWLLKEELTLPDTLTQDEYLAQLKTREPTLGSQVDLSPPEFAERPDGNLLVVLLGACTECSKKSADLASVDLSRFETVAAVTVSEALDLRALPPAKVSVRVVNDTSIHQALNAYWAPRFALLDHEGVLLAIQQESETAEAFISRCPDEE